MAWPSVYNLDAGQFDQRTTQASNRPTIVLVHDAFHTPSHFDPLVRELRETRYRVLLPQLPSSSSVHQPHVFEADQRAIIDLCRPEIEGGRNIIMVLHGYAGVPGPIAAEMLNRYAITRPGSGFVVKVVFLAAIVVSEGECVLDVIRPDWLIQDVRSLRLYRILDSSS